jgi:hypothetical protein
MDCIRSRGIETKVVKSRRRWARLRWVVYLFDDDDVRRSVDHVERNALKSGKPREHWHLVTPWR